MQKTKKNQIKPINASSKTIKSTKKFLKETQNKTQNKTLIEIK